MSSRWSEAKEIKIPVSYGFLAAKVWGDEKGERVLAMHGWQNNAGSFDKIIPLLESNLYIVAFDSAGHGLSSHKPPGTFYHLVEALVDVHRVVEYLNWETFSIIGHSFGGALGILYSSIFPTRVENLVLIDVIKPPSCPLSELSDVTRKGIQNYLAFEKKYSDEVPVYTFKEIKDRLISGTFHQITEESANTLLKRGCKTSDCGTGVVFTRDVRVKMMGELHHFSDNELKALMEKMDCNLLLIVATEDRIFKSNVSANIHDVSMIYKMNCKSLKVVRVQGTHFVHLNNPDRVAPHVDNFFRFYNNASKL